MADYREISQEYAQGAIKAVILANGGMAIALMSQIETIATFVSPRLVAGLAFTACLGVGFGIVTWVIAFVATRNVDRVLQGQDESYTTADRLMTIGVLAILVSLFCFIVPPMVLTFAISAQPEP